MLDLIGMPYLAIITSNMKFLSERIDLSGIITYRLPEHTFRTWGLYESQLLVQADSSPTAPTSSETFHNTGRERLIRTRLIRSST